MPRMLALVGAIALLAGCQSQGANPFGGIGPSTIPPPAGATPGSLPYYPPGQPASTMPPTITVPGATSFAPPANNGPARTNISVSPPAAPGNTIVSTLASDPADRQPIRVVEGASSATGGSTAVAAAPPARPGAMQAAPAAREPIQAFANTAGGRQPVEVSQAPQSDGYAPAGTSPAYNRTRGFPTPPATSPTPPPANAIPAIRGQSTGDFRTDRSVSPAGFMEPAGSQGAWRPR